MDRPIWAPWRIEYILSDKGDGCIFCQALEAGGEKDKDNLVLHRGDSAFIMMNLYPYNPGHLMVAPNEHVSELEEVSREATIEMMELTKLSITVLKSEMSPQGFNSGFNIGEIGGASIKEHLHMHVVPRWQGDNNFIQVLADTNVVPQALSDTYDLLAAGFRALRS